MLKPSDKKIARAAAIFTKIRKLIPSENQLPAILCCSLKNTWAISKQNLQFHISLTVLRQSVKNPVLHFFAYYSGAICGWGKGGGAWLHFECY